MVFTASATAAIVHGTVVDVAAGKESPGQTVFPAGRPHPFSFGFRSYCAANRPRNRRSPRLFHSRPLGHARPHRWSRGLASLHRQRGHWRAPHVRRKKRQVLRAKFSATPIAPEILIGSALVDGDPPVWPGSIVIHNAKTPAASSAKSRKAAPTSWKFTTALPATPISPWLTRPANKEFPLSAIFLLKSVPPKLPTPASAPSSTSPVSPSPVPGASRIWSSSFARSTTKHESDRRGHPQLRLGRVRSAFRPVPQQQDLAGSHAHRPSRPRLHEWAAIHFRGARRLHERRVAP